MRAESSTAGVPGSVRRVIDQISRDVVILGDRLVRLADEAPEMALSEVTLLPNEQLIDPLVAALTERLYARVYCRRSTQQKRRDPRDDMLEALRRANAGTDRWDEGWEFLGADERGAALVRSGSRTRLQEPGTCRIGREEPVGDASSLAVGCSIAIHRPCEDIESQPDYYYALGEVAGDRYEELVGARLYLNVRPQSSAHWVGVVSYALNRYRIPFAFKVLRHRSSYRRIDSGVLYVPRRHAGFVARLVIALAGDAHGDNRLRPPTPAFTRRIAPGLALADSPPGGESFGISRMQLVAQAIVYAWRAGHVSSAARTSAIETAFRVAGLDLARPWLNPGNVEVKIGGPRLSTASSSTPSTDWADVADRIGAQIVRDAVWDSDECTWLGWQVIPGLQTHRTAVCALGGDLYTGTAGIALFLAELASVTGDPFQRATALGAFRHSLCELGRGDWSIGAYSGLAGVLRAALVLADLTSEEQVVDSIPGMIGRLVAAQPPERELDIIEGRAGAIGVLLEIADLGEAQMGDHALDTACRFGHDILGGAGAPAGQWTRDTVGPEPDDPLLGFAHGRVGIAAALFGLHDATGDPAFLLGAEKALGSEWQELEAAMHHWTDRAERQRREPREPSGDDMAGMSFTSAWCRGASGVALALAPHVAKSADPRTRGHFDAALGTTLASVETRPGATEPRGPSFCLCHGTAGNADVLVQIADLTGRAELREAALSAADYGRRSYHDTGTWPCGIRGGGHSPSLMLGTAGIGQFFLRLHSPRLASVLNAGSVPHADKAIT
jgi:hypothetical protein